MENEAKRRFEIFVIILNFSCVIGVLLSLGGHFKIIRYLGFIIFILTIVLDLLYTPVRIDLAKKYNVEEPRLPLIVFIIAGIGWIVGLVYILTGGFLVLRQCFVFFKNGDWIPYSGIDFIIGCKSILILGNDLSNWAILQNSWIGIHKILSFLNGGLIGIGLGIIILTVSIFLPSYYWAKKYWGSQKEKKHPTEKQC